MHMPLSWVLSFISLVLGFRMGNHRQPIPSGIPPISRHVNFRPTAKYENITGKFLVLPVLFHAYNPSKSEKFADTCMNCHIHSQ